MAGIKIGSAAMIEIGYAGENRTREIIFDAKEWMERLPGCEPAIVGVRADGVEFTAPDVRKDEEEKTIIWTLTDGETIAGEGEAQLLWMDGERVAKRAIVVTMCRASLETEATVPGAPEPIWGRQAVEAMQRAEEAAAKAETARGSILHEKETAMMEIRGAVTSANDAAASAAEMVQKTQNAATSAEEQRQAAENAAKNAQEDEEKAQQWAAGAQTYAGAAESAQSHAQGYAQTAQTASAKAETDAREARNASEIAKNAAARAEEAAGSVEDGGYYEPTVSQTGLLTWNPSKEGMPFPNAVNIQGPRGLTGATGGTPTFDIGREENGTRITITTPNVPNPGMPDTPATYQSFTIPDGEKGERGEPGTIPIIAESDGNVIAIEDSAAFPVRGFTLYGKTTQNGTPTPDAPVELKTVGADGNVVVSSAGKNLFNISQSPSRVVSASVEQIENGVRVISEHQTQTYTVAQWDVVRGLSGMASKCVTLSAHVSPSGEHTGRVWLAVYGEDGNEVGTSQRESGSGKLTTTLAISEEQAQKGNVIRAGLYAIVTGTAGRGVYTDYTDVQFEIGSEATEYVPYIGQAASISTANGLPGVPITSGGNYTDANGQQWIADAIAYNSDDGTAKYVKRVHLVRLTSTSHNWAAHATAANRFITNNPSPAFLPGVAPVCSAFRGSKGATETEGYVYINGTTQFGFTINLATLDEWKAFLDANEVYLAYAMATPIKTKLSEEETAQIAALKTYYPETTVYNEDSAHMEIKYVADTKNYIDKKIEAIAAAMLAKI